MSLYEHKLNYTVYTIINGGWVGVWVRVTVGKERQPPASLNEFALISNDNISAEMRP